MEALKRIVITIDTINRRTGALVKYLIAALMLLIVYEVIARYALNSPSIWALETSQFLFCTMISLSGGWALLRRKHVNVSIIRDRMGTRTGAILDIIVWPLFFLFITAFLSQSLIATANGFAHFEHSGTYWNPPIFPIYAIVTVGIIFISLQGLAQLIRSIVIVIWGERSANFPGTEKS